MSFKPAHFPRRALGRSDLYVSPVGLGLWPISGVSTLNTNDDDSLATIHAAIDAGVNHIDTAYSYGYDGESDKLLARVLADRRHELVVASKVGLSFDEQQQKTIDGRPEVLMAHTQQVLARLEIDQVDIMYLHLPDGRVPLQESASAIAEIVSRGWARYAGVSNVSAEQLAEFHSVCPVTVVQPPFNMLQQSAVSEIRDYCTQQQISIACYWVLMKGLLAGKLARDHRFDPRDKRLTYPIYQGQQWERSQDLLDQLRDLAQQLDCTVSQIVVAWTLAQPGIDIALCGAKRPEQIQETAQAMQLKLSPEALASIDGWVAQTGGMP